TLSPLLNSMANAMAPSSVTVTSSSPAVTVNSPSKPVTVPDNRYVGAGGGGVTLAGGASLLSLAQALSTPTHTNDNASLVGLFIFLSIDTEVRSGLPFVFTL